MLSLGKGKRRMDLLHTLCTLLFMSPCHIQHTAMLAALFDCTFKGKFFAKEADTKQLGYENWHLELTFVVSAVP